MKPGDEVSVIGLLFGRAYLEGRAVLVEDIGRPWWRVRFADGVIESRKIYPEQQDDPAAWIRQHNEERTSHAHP